MSQIEKAKPSQPTLRFAEYNGNWDCVTLEQIVDVKSGRDYKHLNKGDIPVYGTGGYMLSVDKALSYTEDAIGIGRKGTIDKPYVLNAPFWTVDTLFYAVPKINNNLQFIYSIFQKINWREKDESTGVPSLSKLNINHISTFKCENKEQTKIGNFFQNLDKQLKLHRDKLAKQQQLKKAMLGKMFPKAGAKVPEIRFAGFSEDWVYSSVSSLCSISTGKSNTQDKIKDGIYPFYVRSPIIEKSNRYLYEEEAVLTVGDGVGTGKVYHYVNGKYDLHQRVYRMYNFINVVGPFFYLFFSENFGKRVAAMTAKTSVDSVRLEMIANMEMQYPTSKNEQKKIGEYFQNIESLIALQQQQINKLKNIKQACLDKMFV